MEDHHGSIVFSRFTHATLSLNPELLSDLAKFYCSIWMYDPFFREYKTCPVCKKYYSYEEVTAGKVTCSGVSMYHPTSPLEDAWNPGKVAEDLLCQSAQYGERFYGAIAYDTETNHIVGFTWGFVQPWEEINSEWGTTIADYVGSNAVYFSELAADLDIRNKRLGTRLSKMLITWMKENYPNLPTFLRTHEKSFARRIFEKAGYSYFAEDPMHGDGRIMLMVPSCKNLKPDLLVY